MARALARQVVLREPAQLVVHQRDEPVHCTFVAVFHGGEQCGHSFCRRRHERLAGALRCRARTMAARDSDEHKRESRPDGDIAADVGRSSIRAELLLPDQECYKDPTQMRHRSVYGTKNQLECSHY